MKRLGLTVLILTGICTPAIVPASPGAEKTSGQAGGPGLAPQVRVQLQKLAPAVNLARIEWSETDSGEDWSGVYAKPERVTV